MYVHVRMCTCMYACVHACVNKHDARIGRLGHVKSPLKVGLSVLWGCFVLKRDFVFLKDNPNMLN